MPESTATFSVEAAGKVYNQTNEGYNDWGGRGYDHFVPGEVTKTTPSGDKTT